MWTLRTDEANGAGADGVTIRGSGTFGAVAVSKNGNVALSLEDGEFTVALITSLGKPLSAADGYYVKSISSSGCGIRLH